MRPAGFPAVSPGGNATSTRLGAAVAAAGVGMTGRTGPDGAAVGRGRTVRSGFAPAGAGTGAVVCGPGGSDGRVVAGAGAAPVPDTTPAKPAELAQALPAAVQTSPWAAEGLVILQEFPKLGTTYVLMDRDQRVVAFLKTADGAIQLSELNYRYVGVKGSQERVDRALHGLESDPPVITVGEAALLNR